MPIAVADRRHINLPCLVLLFIGSGCAALIYEVVWLQLLQLVLKVVLKQIIKRDQIILVLIE